VLLSRAQKGARVRTNSISFSAEPQSEPELGAGKVICTYKQTLKGYDVNLLYIIAVVLMILWLLGMVSSYTIGGFIHILLVIAVVVILVRIISGRKPL
jgi:hypothetical protein